MISDTNINNINSNIDFKEALGSIYEMLKQLQTIPEAKKIYEMELLKQACMDAVEYFINQNMQSIKDKQIQIEPIINQINDNAFFNQEMKDLVKQNLTQQMMKWHEFITDEMANSIANEVLKLEAK
jgi:hypothetical protein